MLWWLLACGPRSNNACPTSNNGTCDEMVTCAIGTDSKDCDQACEDWSPSDKDWRMAGVCALDQGNTLVKWEQTNGVGSKGSGGLVGSYDDIVTVRGSRLSDVVDRQYRVYVPRRYSDDRPTPVMFALGGFTVDMYWLAEFTELNRMADRENFIVVYGHPEWRDFGSYDVFSWYVYTEAFQGDWVDNPDISYMETIIDKLGVSYNIDLSRVYVSGHSRGAALSIIASFERPDLFAGYCAQAGFASSNNYNVRIEELAATQRTPGVLIHGDADPDVRVRESDLISDIFEDANWSYPDDWRYFRIPGATHEWQSHLNQEMWDWLYDHPNPNIRGGGQ